MPSHSRMRGLTFVELMATLLVVSVVAAFALPSFLDMTRSNRAQAQAGDLLRTLNYARSEAIRRNERIYVTALNGDKDWGVKGWRVWVDQDGDAAYSADKDLELRVEAPLSGATLVSANEDAVSEVVFLGTGFLNKKLTDDPVQFSYRVENKCNLGRDIILMPAGRASVSMQGGC